MTNLLECHRRVVVAAVQLAPDHAALLARRGESKAGLADPEGALADWEHALEIDPDDIGPLYSSAVLLEGEGRIAAAGDAWRSILDWNESRGLNLQREWPREQLARLQDP
jgi:tetratricopeptide (TPR) repeat protein